MEQVEYIKYLYYPPICEWTSGKQCNTCKKIKPLTAFESEITGIYGRNNQCIECFNCREEDKVEQIKRCSCCGRFLGEKSFNFKNREKEIRFSYCKRCGKVKSYLYRVCNIEKERARQKLYYEDPINKEHRRQYIEVYYQNEENRKRKVRKALMRRCTILNQTPLDADWKKINQIYEFADQLNKMCGYVAYQVDHIIPVSKGGLHCHTNLQVLPTYLNRKKFNKIVEDDEYVGIRWDDVKDLNLLS